ncbi:MAG TPA: class I SAM-dependent methyltransferase [Candidatus Limnocylindrales bacterium]|nr:class I SAM-dependent methyltransferase [Candidatus Limnocylindrales bacterium]
MTDDTGRGERMAAGYEQHWAPVLAPSAVVLLGQLDGPIGAGAHDVLDVGVGTGNLSIPALDRWPTIAITGLDAAPEMVTAVEGLVGERVPHAMGRFRAVTADAAEMPFDDCTFDVAMSSFVLQLVRRRPAVLREIRRVLRPGGTFGFVTWLRDARVFEPDRVFDSLLEAYGFENEPDAPRSGDFATAERAAAELRRAGFRDVTATRATLDHAFSVESYIAFLTEFDEESLFDEMGRAERRRFLREFRERLMGLDPDVFHFRVPIVYATGRRPA